jgi:hypothetical protein
MEEIEQLRTFVTVHAFQLGELSRSEYEQGVRATRWTRSAPPGAKSCRFAPMRQGALPL